MTEARARRMGRPTRDEAATLMGEILDRTLHALCARGREGMSLDTLARDVGVTKRTLYRHFENKAALIEAVVTREIERIQNATVDPAHERRSPLAALRDCASHLFHHARKPEIIRFTAFIEFEAGSDLAFSLKRRKWHALIMDHVSGLVAAAQASGQLVAAPARTVAVMLMDIIQGASSRAGYDDAAGGSPCPAEADRFFDMRWDAFLRVAAPDPCPRVRWPEAVDA